MFILFIILVCISCAIGIWILVFIFSTEPEPKFDKTNCLYNSDIGLSSSLIETDNGFLIKDFTTNSDNFRALNKWKIGDQNTAWKNTKTGKIVLDGNFFISAPGPSISAWEDGTPIAILQNTDFSDTQLRELIIFLVEVVSKESLGHGEVCLYQEINTNTTYRADFSLIDREYTNTETLYLSDLSLEINKLTGEVVEIITYRGSLIKEGMGLFGRSRYRSNNY